jgi:two-component sensor histidine kinase
MVFHELATNAAKHGALSNGAAGKIDIVWQVEPTPQGDRMRLRWQESGGPLVTPPGRKGFGSRLIEGGLAQELDGRSPPRVRARRRGLPDHHACPARSGWMSHE